MKVFFCSSPRAKKQYSENIIKIHETLEKLGYEHTSDFIIDVDIDKFYSGNQKSVLGHYREMVEGIKKADIVIFEASIHSLAVGYLVNLSLEQGKPVIILHLKRSPPFLFENIQNDKLIVVFYEAETLEKTLSGALEEAKEQMDVRFNFFISPKIGSYLGWIARRKKIPRAVYLRRLIEEDMKKSKEYKG